MVWMIWSQCRERLSGQRVGGQCAGGYESCCGLRCRELDVDGLEKERKTIGRRDIDRSSLWMGCQYPGFWLRGGVGVSSHWRGCRHTLQYGGALAHDAHLTRRFVGCFCLPWDERAVGRFGHRNFCYNNGKLYWGEWVVVREP